MSRATPLVEVVRDIFFDRRNGVLTVTSGDRVAELYFENGEVFYCKVNSPDQRLDRLLVKWGLVSESAVADLLRRAGQDPRGALVREGIFPDEAAFDRFMSEALRERMADTLGLGEAPHEFAERDVSGLRAVRFEVTTPNVILEGARRMAGDGLSVLTEDDSPLSLNPQPTVPVQSLELGPAEGYVLSMLDGTTTPTAVLRTSPLGEGETLRLLHALLLLDVARHPAFAGYRFSLAALAKRAAEASQREREEAKRIEDEYRRVRSIDIFHLLPGGAGLSGEELRAALKDYQAEWRPERFSVRVAREKREQLALIAGRAGEALLTTMDSRRREGGEVPGDDRAVDGRLTRLEFAKSQAQEAQAEAAQQARQYFDRGLEAYRSKDFHSAVQYLREAVRRHETAEYQELLGDALRQNPHWRKRAQEAYSRSAELDRFNPDVVLKLGRLFAQSGLTDRARAQFERCLEIQPDHEEAKLAIKRLKRR